MGEEDYIIYNSDGTMSTTGGRIWTDYISSGKPLVDADALNKIVVAAKNMEKSLKDVGTAAHAAGETPAQKMARLTETNENLREEVEGWQDVYEGSQAENARLREEAQRLRDEIAILRYNAATKPVPIPSVPGPGPYFDGTKAPNTGTYTYTASGTTGALITDANIKGMSITVSPEPGMDAEQLAAKISRNMKTIQSRMKDTK